MRTLTPRHAGEQRTHGTRTIKFGGVAVARRYRLQLAFHSGAQQPGARLKPMGPVQGLALADGGTVVGIGTQSCIVNRSLARLAQAQFTAPVGADLVVAVDGPSRQLAGAEITVRRPPESAAVRFETPVTALYAQAQGLPGDQLPGHRDIKVAIAVTIGIPIFMGVLVRVHR